MKITASKLEDLSEILRLYELATAFQKIKFPANQWPEFSENLILKEIDESRQFKLLINNEIACVWAITHSDPYIWENSERDAAVYIHRIATNPEFRGNNFVESIVNWSKDYANRNNLQFIRMDTCGYNEKLINHYKKCGFNFLGMDTLKDSSHLPSHYHDADVCFFQIDLNA